MNALIIFFIAHLLFCQNNNDIITLEDINSKPTMIDIKETTVFFIFYNGPACSLCYTKIEQYIRKNFSESKIYLILITPPDIKVRLEIKEYTKRFIRPDGYFYGCGKDDLLYEAFKKSSKSTSPNVLKISSSGVKSYSFDDIFDEKGYLKLKFE